MKTAFVVALLAAAACARLSDAQEWANFKTRFGRTYTAAEDAKRFTVFAANLARADAMTARAHARDGAIAAHYGVTRFSDLTQEEFLATYTGHIESVAQSNLPVLPHTKKVSALGTDWTSEGIVTPVKDQGSCGSCWAFSATAAIEGCYAQLNGEQANISVQQIMDCCKGTGCNGGCNGGFEYDALEWAVTADLTTDEKFPYKKKKAASCKKVAAADVVLPKGSCDFFKTETPDEDAMVAALEKGVLTIALDATVLQLYSSGVIKADCADWSGLNHALLLVSDDGAGDTYVVKNSWGAAWGEDGYFRMAKGVGCLGIDQDAHSVAFPASL